MTAADPVRAPVPPVLRPRRSTRHLLTDLVAQFGAELHGDGVGVTLTGITLATADLRRGEAFVALRGGTRHGAAFAKDAAAAGAVAVITDAAGAALAADCGLPIVVVPDPRALLGDLSAWVYDTDDDLPVLLATTGTNGKTSVTHLLDGILAQLGVVTGLSSTAERHIAGDVIVSRLTTPEASEFHALLARMREDGVAAVAAEVSAQALSRHRVDGVVFDVAGFTNLSHDHLDDFGDMAGYLQAKLALFTPEHARRGVVSLDSPYGADVAARSTVPVTTILTSAVASDPAQSSDWAVDVVAARPDGTEFTLTGPRGRSLTTTVPVIGAHMAANAGLAIVMLLEAGYPWHLLVEALHGRRIEADLPGRTQRVSAERGPAVYLDFGHSPDAFEKTLAAVRAVTTGRVVMVVGADGDRDASKRADMGRTAAEGSDLLIVTDHHPRHEDPAAIRAALIAGARAARPDAEVLEFSPPERAIVEAVARAGETDAIVWAGPGHQDYRDIRGVRAAYSARELARRALRDAGWPVPEPSWPVPYPAESTPLSDPGTEWR